MASAKSRMRRASRRETKYETSVVGKKKRASTPAIRMTLTPTQE
jgi:hypothetical protein